MIEHKVMPLSGIYNLLGVLFDNIEANPYKLRLLTSGLIKPIVGDRVRLSRKGRRYLEMLEAVPLPIEKPIETEWIDPRECGE